MAELQFSTPLKWPPGRDMTSAAEKAYTAGAPSSMKIEDAIEYVRAEVKEFPAENIALTTDYLNVNDESIRSKSGSSSGASLLIEYRSTHYIIACDKYNTLQLNIYALHLMLRHIMQMVKWGLGDISALLQGFLVDKNMIRDSLSAIAGNEWWLQYLGLGPTAKLSDANAVYRSRAKEMADNSDALLKLNEAISIARKVLS